MCAATETSAFVRTLNAAQFRNDSLVCVGLDPRLDRMPEGFPGVPASIAAFNRSIIEATADIACCYKPNLGFYLPFGIAGIEALEQVRRDVPAHIPVLLDAKLGDIDITSIGYARAVFETWGFDAVTVNPLLGYDALQPFIDYADRGVFVLAKTSNAGSGLLQDRTLAGDIQETVTEAIARNAGDWNVHGNIGLVVGATYPDQLAAVRRIAPGLPILVPGVGAQAGDLEASVRAGLDSQGAGIIVNASRSISNASSGTDFQHAAREAASHLRDAINDVRR